MEVFFYDRRLPGRKGTLGPSGRDGGGFCTLLIDFNEGLVNHFRNLQWFFTIVADPPQIGMVTKSELGPHVTQHGCQVKFRFHLETRKRDHNNLFVA